jgi:cell division protease FtsH
MKPHGFNSNTALKAGPPRSDPGVTQPRPPRRRFWLWAVGVGVTALLFAAPALVTTSSVRQLSFSAFQSEVRAGQIKTATVGATGQVSGEQTEGGKYTTQIPTALGDTSINSLLTEHHVDVVGAAPDRGVSLLRIALDFLPLILIVGYIIYIGRKAKAQLGSSGLGGRLMGIGSSKAKVYDEQRPTTRFGDIAGYEGPKREISEVIEFLRNPDRFKKAGAVGPKGVLMIGPPGTGKTLMARAVAGEADVPFFAITGSSFVEMFVGVGASRVRDLFNAARKRSPSIVFIDEIDAIGGKRGSSFGGHEEREQTLNQLLAEMDGFDPAEGVVVLAATNRPETLDAALLRPGRFDRTVEIPLPNLPERKAILAVHTATKQLSDDVDLDLVARGTPGFSGADLANLVNEAALHAVRRGRSVAEAADFDSARDRILLGPRGSSSGLLTDEQLCVAVHETGHALVAVLLPHADPVAKVTILPAGRSLGVTEQVPLVDRRLYSRSYLLDSLAVRLGGRAAELIVLGEPSTGASNDLAGATQLATRMVRDWGLSERIGPVGYGEDHPGYLGDGPLTSRTYAEATQRAIDEEVAGLLRDAQERASSLLSDHRSDLDRIVAELLEHETIDGKQLMSIVGIGPGVHPLDHHT